MFGKKASETLISDFTCELASKAPTPGGGGSAALAGALGAALGSMVANLTIGKKKYADVEAEMAKQLATANELRARLLGLADADAEAFFPLSQAYSMPTETDAQKAEKDDIMEQALKAACEVPIEIMRSVAETVSVIEFMAEKGSVMVISDAAAGAALCAGALKAASLNVFINAKSMKDRAAAKDYKSTAHSILEKYIPLADRVFESVLKKLNPEIGE